MVSTTKRTSVTVVVAFFILGGIVVSFVAVADIYGRQALNQGTESTIAKVTDHELNPCRGFDCGPPYRIKYSFHAADGRGPFTYTGQQIFFEAWVRIPSSAWLTALERQNVEIRYAKADPRINEPATTAHYSSANGWGLIVLAIFEFGCAAMIVRAYSRPRTSLGRARE